MSSFRTIVVATDFSDTSRDALRVALELAHDFSGQLYVLHVVPDIWHQPLNVDEPFTETATMERQWVEEAERRLKTFLADEGVDEHQVRSEAVIGVPGSSIVR